MSVLSSFLDWVRYVTPPEPAVVTRAAAPFEVNIPGVFGIGRTPWRTMSVKEALGVPAIQRCVTLISNTVGVLSLDAIRNGVQLDERPSLVVRPNPLTTPRVFFRDTAYHLATRGEAFWWVARRGSDGEAMSLVPIKPWEVKVEEGRDLRYPVFRWRDRVMPNADFRHLTLQPDPDGGMRGAGPLQLCGAAISVSVESQEWAANFYSEGGYPSVYLKSDYDFQDEDEAQKVKDKWAHGAPNTPRLLSPGLEPGVLPVSESGTQALASRDFQTSEAARMFGIPGTLLDYSASGSQVTYSNVGDESDKFVRSCLWPNYLEPIEQELSDLLTRSTIARFNLTALLRPDPMTRMNVHEKAIASGIYDAAEARVIEGLDPGSIETAPVPLAPPQALPPVIEMRTAEPVRCDGLRSMRGRLVACGKLLAEAGPFVGRCSRCKKEYALVAA